MDKFTKRIGIFYIFLLIIAIYLTNMSHNSDVENIEKLTKECIDVGGDEYYYWSKECIKVIQERKTTIIYKK